MKHYLKATEPKDLAGTVHYDSSNFVGILFQMHGSVWPKVLPFCIWNAAVTYAVNYLLVHDIVDLTFSDKGHQFMNIIVAFLVVSRVNMAVSRFLEQRSNLGKINNACRELIHHACVLTQDKQSDRAKEWRYDIASKTLLCLRTACAVLDYDCSKEVAWSIPELDATEANALCHCNFLDEYHPDGEIVAWSHGQKTERQENCRVPVNMVYSLRSIIVSNRTKLEERLSPLEEMKLLGCVDNFMSGYAALRKNITTQFPFPLVQMERTFLFAWLFTLPFAIADDLTKGWHASATMFVLTFGFLGLEYVAIELDDPFGFDPNDFDNVGIAHCVFEDIYLSIMHVDGIESAGRLYSKMARTSNIGSHPSRKISPRGVQDIEQAGVAAFTHLQPEKEFYDSVCRYE